MLSARRREALWHRFDAWGFDTRGWSRNTRQRYYRTARAADEWLIQNRNVSLLFASARDLQAYLFSRPPVARTRNAVRSGLVGFGEFLVDVGLSKANEAKVLPRLPEPAAIPEALTKKEAHRVDVCADLLDREGRALVLVYLYGGLRRDEARLLEWADVEGSWLRVRGKGGHERRVPLHERAADALWTWRESCPDARWVFPSPDQRRFPGRPIGGSTVRYIVRAVGEMAGLPDLHPHQLRHTVATLLLESGANERTVQEFLGHKRLDTTAIYTRIRPAGVEDAVRRLDLGG